jgi:hypothetical protein
MAVKVEIAAVATARAPIRFMGASDTGSTFDSGLLYDLDSGPQPIYIFAGAAQGPFSVGPDTCFLFWSPFTS